MTDDPFLTLVVEALNLMHPRFAAASGLAYPANETDTPAAARKDRERPFVLELYHQFRRLWDKALPVKLGLGHLVLKFDPPGADLPMWQVGEGGQPDRPLGAVTVACGSNPAAVGADLVRLTRLRAAGFRHAVAVVVGPSADPVTPPAGVEIVRFDPDRWAVASQ